MSHLRSYILILLKNGAIACLSYPTIALKERHLSAASSFPSAAKFQMHVTAKHQKACQQQQHNHQLQGLPKSRLAYLHALPQGSPHLILAQALPNPPGSLMHRLFCSLGTPQDSPGSAFLQLDLMIFSVFSNRNESIRIRYCCRSSCCKSPHIIISSKLNPIIRPSSLSRQQCSEFFCRQGYSRRYHSLSGQGDQPF